MRLALLPLLFLLSSIPLTAQQKLPEWYRVYTFDDSIVEMNTSQLILDGQDDGRVIFRWTFDRPVSLKGEQNVKYKSRVELWEVRCADKEFRPYETTLYDSAGTAVRQEVMTPSSRWEPVVADSMTARLFVPACELIKRRARGPVLTSNDVTEKDKVTRYAFSFAQSLQRAKDFKPIIEKFFATDYLNGYIKDSRRNWFPNLDRETAAKLSHQELQRFYVAYLNAGFLSCLYVISQNPSEQAESVPDKDLIPKDVIQLIRNHPYSTRYKREDGNYDFLDESIDSADRLRSYTDLLEKIGALMRKHAKRVEGNNTIKYQQMVLNEAWDVDLYNPEIIVCEAECFGLPKGTRLFEVDVPVFHLQIAEIGGELKVVSAIEYFQ